jgi:hypothetical protein
MAFDVNAWMEEARALGHRLHAFCRPYYMAAKRKATDFMQSKDRLSDASFRNGLLQAFLTCVVLAPIPLMYGLWMLNASFWYEAPLWYGLVLFMNVPQKMMPWKAVAQYMFIAVVCLLCWFQYCHWLWACLMCCLSFLRMNGKGKTMVLWQLRVESYMYEYVHAMFNTTMSADAIVNAVKSDNMICNPDTFIWCAMVAYNWEAWQRAGFDLDLRDWTRIVSFKRAFVALNLWRVVVFVLPYTVCVLVRHFWPVTVGTATVDQEFDQAAAKPESAGNMTQEEHEMWMEFLKDVE